MLGKFICFNFDHFSRPDFEEVDCTWIVKLGETVCIWEINWWLYLVRVYVQIISDVKEEKKWWFRSHYRSLSSFRSCVNCSVVQSFVSPVFTFCLPFCHLFCALYISFTYSFYLSLVFCIFSLLLSLFHPFSFLFRTKTRLVLTRPLVSQPKLIMKPRQIMRILFRSSTSNPIWSVFMLCTSSSKRVLPLHKRRRTRKKHLYQLWRLVIISGEWAFSSLVRL